MSKGFADYTPLTIERPMALADRCAKKSSLLTVEEIEQYKMQLRLGGIPCRTCEKDIVPVNRCTDELQGPFTYVIKCMRCPRFEPIADIT
jgi:hypothetical protein